MIVSIGKDVINIVKVVMGLVGSGKTKKLVSLVNEALKAEDGDVVVIEKELKLTYDIPYQARLVTAADYNINSYELLRGLICGLHAGNYDIKYIFIDNFLKLVNDKSTEGMESFFTWLKAFSEKENLEFVVSISAEVETAPAIVKDLIISTAI